MIKLLSRQLLLVLMLCASAASAKDHKVPLDVLSAELEAAAVETEESQSDDSKETVRDLMRRRYDDRKYRRAKEEFTDALTVDASGISYLIDLWLEQKRMAKLMKNSPMAPPTKDSFIARIEFRDVESILLTTKKKNKGGIELRAINFNLKESARQPDESAEGWSAQPQGDSIEFPLTLKGDEVRQFVVALNELREAAN